MMKNNLYRSLLRKLMLMSAGALVVLPALAETGASATSKDEIANPLAQILLIIIIFLAVAIGVLANVLKGATDIYRERMRKEKQKGATAQSLLMLVLVAGACCLSGTAKAQAVATEAAAVADSSISGLRASTFYTMVGVIALEILILVALTIQLKVLLGLERKHKARPVVEGMPRVSWWDKMNKSVAIEKETEIDLHHEYDGIRELDNSIPPWWKLSFIGTVILGIVYMWQYHVAESAPLQLEELKIAMTKAEEEKAEYLQKSANNVNENTVVMLDAGGIAAGKALFGANCVACHGSVGQGASVGPNLSDAYWLHGGTIKDVFKTINYGWPDKGMRSWKDDFSPVQIAQLSSYVLSLQGSNPPDGKEPQGELMKEAAATDSTKSSTAPVTKTGK